MTSTDAFFALLEAHPRAPLAELEAEAQAWAAVYLDRERNRAPQRQFCHRPHETEPALEGA